MQNGFENNRFHAEYAHTKYRILGAGRTSKHPGILGSKNPRIFGLWWAPGASVFDSKVLCQEMYLAARRSGMLDAGLLLVSYSGEVRFQMKKWNLFWRRFTGWGCGFLHRNVVKSFARLLQYFFFGGGKGAISWYILHQYHVSPRYERQMIDM